MKLDEHVKKDLLDWQKQQCALSESLTELKHTLLLKLNKQLESLYLSNSLAPHSAAALARKAFIEKLTQLPENCQELVLMIEDGIKNFNHYPADLNYVLLRAGEDLVQQYHVENEIAYRPEVYLSLIEAEKICNIHETDFFRIYYKGDPKAAFPLLKSAATPSAHYLGSPEAQFLLARMYRINLFRTKNDAEEDHNKMAVFYYQLAAERRPDKVCVKLAKMYILGEGVEGDTPNVEKAIEYLKLGMGNKLHLWNSEELEYILMLVDKQDELAIKFLTEKLASHHEAVRHKMDAIQELIKEDGASEFYHTVSAFRSGNSYVMPPKKYSDAGCLNLHQIHFLADSAGTRYTPRLEGYIFAKEILQNIYQMIAEHAAMPGVKKYFEQIACIYKKRIDNQRIEELEEKKTSTRAVTTVGSPSTESLEWLHKWRSIVPTASHRDTPETALTTSRAHSKNSARKSWS